MSTLDNLRREAKHWLKALRAQDPSARTRLAAAWPDAPDTPTLRDVQQALAREHGFDSWVAFKAAIARRAAPPRPESGQSIAEVAESFIRFACWEHHTHGASDYESHAKSAMRLLALHPEVAGLSLQTAIVCGNVPVVQQLLGADPESARRKAGPRGWEPLLYLCFARLPLPALDQHAVTIAGLLLDRGADPNTYYMAGSAKYSALVGVAGEGEQDAPRSQPYKAALYRRLLQRGADPYDMQVLYNTHFSGDMLWWLQLTYEHDVDRDDVTAWQDPGWKMLDMGGYGPGAYFVLHVAIEKNDLALAEWALAHGADPNVMSSSHPKFTPRFSLYQEAVAWGRESMADLLLRHGATPLAVSVEGELAFVQACVQSDSARIRALAAEHPEYLQSPRALHAVAERDLVDVVRLLLDLGAPVDVEDAARQRPLHLAAGANAVRAAALLIERGAQIDPRETQWGATPLGFAIYGNHREMIRLLAPLTHNVWHLARLGETTRLRQVLHDEPDRAREVSPDGATPLMRLPDDDDRALEVVEILLAHEADASARTRHEGKTAADEARRRGLEGAARRLSSAAPMPPAPLPGPTLRKFESLAKDLVVAFESGEPGAMARLAAQYGGPADWDRVREGVRHYLATVPEAEVPSGYFGLAHARLVIARISGFQNWHHLVAVLGPSGAGRAAPAASGTYAPDLGPGMIQPIEMKAGLRVRLPDGTHVTTSSVWDTLVAARNGNLERVQELVASNAGLVLCDYNYMTPLHLAVREGHFGVVQYLLEEGAGNPKYVTYPYRESLVTVACDRGYDDIARALEAAYAAETRERKEEEGGEIEYERDEDALRFQRLVNVDALSEAEAMLRDRPDLALDEFAFWSEGILSMPANRRHRDMIDLLLRFGARVPAVTKWGAWYYFKHLDIATHLLDHGMSVEHMNCHHTTLLHDMAYTGATDKAARLIDRGADIDAVDEEFRSTPLGLAVRFGKAAMVELLLERGADPNKAGAAWATPLEWARKKGHGEIESMLRAGGASQTTAHRAPARDRSAVDRVTAALWKAVDENDAAALSQLLREHRALIAEHRPGFAHLEAETILARRHSRRGLPVRPTIQALEREAEAEGGGSAGRQAVANAYGAGTWERLSLAVRLVDAIWRDDLKGVQALIDAHPSLLHEDALIRTSSNWGPPMTYAANLGRNRIITWLRAQGAKDIDSAMDRAVLQGQIDTARMLVAMGASPLAPPIMEGPAETLNAEGMAFVVELGVPLTAETAPVAMVLETYARNPLGKHQILELFARHGVQLPDTPPMAVHRGRLDLLEKHRRRDPQLFSRTFTHQQMFPRELGCHDDDISALVGTPLGGSGLLNMCIEYDEMELAAWMIEHGADVNLRAQVDADGFGGHTPLFNCVVCLGGGRARHAEFAKLLLARGADPSVRASLRKALQGSDDDSLHEYHDLTAREWGERFHDRSVVNELALDVLRR